jgi:cytidylate kinase|uniref:Cytidylate kinase n=1 Tax=candidate division WOR-3 bacterium TaxID=2052148 RepID=A0A7C6EIT0_UNCW3
MSGFVVAIDGKAGSGKSTTAKGVAKRLNFFYLDTGAMYRAFTLKYIRAGGKKEVDLKLIENLLARTEIELIEHNHNLKILLDGVDVSMEIRTPEVNEMVSPISAIKEVREWMVEKQRKIAQGKNIVCEGRDMTTVVFPEAQVKIFMDADLPTRAERRRKELQEKGIKISFEESLNNLKYRDDYDSSREHSPLKKANDAIVIDTTNLTIEQEIELVEKIVRKRLKSN